MHTLLLYTLLREISPFPILSLNDAEVTKGHVAEDILKVTWTT